MKHTIFSSLTCLLVLQVKLCAAQAVPPAQQEDLLGIIPDAHGAPRLVRDDVGDWHPPVKVYQDAKISIFIPNVMNDQEWIFWHADDFRKTGGYFIFLYTYGLHSHTIHWTQIAVHTKDNTAVISTPGELLSSGLIENLPIAYKTAITRISAILRSTFSNYKGSSMQDATAASRAFNAKIASALDDGGPRAYATNIPRLIGNVVPTYPIEAWNAKITGVVTVGMTIDVNGAPTNLHIVKSVCPSLDNAAMQAVSRGHFEPAHNSATGIPVASEAALDINFQIP
jgi:TonB family protein